MRLLVGLLVAFITPFIMLLIYSLCMIFGAINAAAVTLSIVSLIIAFIAFLIDTQGFEQESSVMKLINKWVAK